MSIITENPKSARRADAKLLRDAMPDELRAQNSKSICQKVTTMASFGLCDIILCYAPLGSEVDVLPIAKDALERGKTVGFPVCDKESGEMEFYSVTSLDELEDGGMFGEKIPPKSEERLITPTRDTMIIMPGLLFDKHGRRIGYGGGYYDKYIRRHDALFYSSMTIGVAYSAFLSDIPIPYSDHDISCAIVVTEKKVNFVRKIEKAPKREVRQRHYKPLIDSEGNPAKQPHRDFYNADYVSPDEGKYKKPSAKDLT
ncbi:MAG: 5-formyltetrahydrofolate cyclo-ligase [Ruminococcaceae bacterium]|nr:5-formyltetrahydrofolate cyclo-ligase [Oscillospiraceae bacterium]